MYCRYVDLIFQFYVLDVVVDFTRLDHDNLFTQLKRIVRLANEEEETPPIGILTAFDRDSWATARMELMKGKSELFP